jgi:hypothetical protein
VGNAPAEITDDQEVRLPYVCLRASNTVAIAVGKKALKGNPEAARMVADRTEGKPRQAIELSGSIPLPSTTSEEIDARLIEILKRARQRAQEHQLPESAHNPEEPPSPAAPS